MSVENLEAGDRIGLYAYGSGAIGEYYSALVCPEARETVAAMKIDEALDSRREVSVEEYEAIEKAREGSIEKPDYSPDFSLLDNWYGSHYEGAGYLVLKGVKDFYRSYEWS